MAKPSELAVGVLMKRMGKGNEKPAPAADEDDDKPITPTAEAAAFKKLRKALSGDDDAAGVAAFKALMGACGYDD